MVDVLGQRISYAVRFCLAAWIAVADVHVTTTAAKSALCSSGAQLASAIADPGISSIQLQADIALDESDWKDFKVPIVIARNLTIWSNLDQPVLLDMAFVTSKAQLRHGATLTFRYIVLTNIRNGSWTQALGLDLLVPMPYGEEAVLRWETCALLFPLCLPLSIVPYDSHTAGRPEQLPGDNILTLPEPRSATCSNSSCTPLLERCYTYTGMFTDVAGLGQDILADDTPEPNGYLLHFLNTRGLCMDVYPVKCVKDYGPTGCVSSTARQQANASSPPGVVGNQSPPATVSGVAMSCASRLNGQSTGRATLAAGVLGGTIGGLILVLSAILVVVVRARREKTLCKDKTSCNPGFNRNDKDSTDSKEATELGRSTARSNDGRRRAAAITISLTADDDPLTQAPAAAGEAGSGMVVNPFSCVLPVTHGTPNRADLTLHIEIHVPVHGAVTAHENNKVEPTVNHSTLGSTDSSDSVLPPTDAASNVVTLLPVVLGKGAFGRVYQGIYQGKRVAVKVVGQEAVWSPGVIVPQGQQGQQQPDCSNNNHNEHLQHLQPPVGLGLPAGMEAGHMFDGGSLRSLQQEVDVLGRCDHPNVVRLLAACLTPPRMCLVMELAETSLEGLVLGDARGGAPLPLDTVLHIAIQVAQGLEYLHPTITHRDLKLANVLINGADSPRPVAKLADFGLSRLRVITQPTQNPDAGTPAWMAPECFDVQNVVITHQVDMYSFGILLWTMLTGRLPWLGHAVLAIAYNVAVLGQRPPLDRLPPDRCPPELRQLIKQCWEADPLRRPAAAEVVKDLQMIAMKYSLSTSTTAHLVTTLNHHMRNVDRRVAEGIQGASDVQPFSGVPHMTILCHASQQARQDVGDSLLKTLTVTEGATTASVADGSCTEQSFYSAKSYR